ncbi:calcium-binding protein [Amaricoccus sp. W119]|uniref:calcium-binding protein n=1 Tax=Amaricoccus sp. W119 TaxID=3391833 RepID=UPI0039A656BD
MGLEGTPEDHDVPLSMSGTFEGGDGNDGIWVDFNAANADQFVTVDAGDGDDRVTVSQVVPNQLGFNNKTHHLESAVRAGDCDDAISVLLRLGDRYETLPGEGGASSTVHGSDGADTITSEVHSFWSDAGAENFVYGGDGEDEILAIAWGGEPSYNRVRGGEGDDRIEMNAVTNSATGDAGNDTISALGSANHGLAHNDISGDEGDDRLEIEARSSTGTAANSGTGGEGDDWIEMVADSDTGTATNSATGDAGNDTISVIGRNYGGSSFNDISGGEGNDRLTARMEHTHPNRYADRAVNWVDGGAGDDRITGIGIIDRAFDSFSELYGREGDDHITARGGSDNILAGNQGDDTLRGGGSSDRLIGGQGADSLRGGGGDDEFVFMSPRGSLEERDRIADFTQGRDLIDISAIDANVFRTGNQAFIFNDLNDFNDFNEATGTGRAWVEEDPDTNGTLLYADTGRGILVVAIRDGQDMDASDYWAFDFVL